MTLSRRTRRTAVVVVAVVASAAFSGSLRLWHPVATSTAGATIPTGSAPVRRTDVVQRQTFAGTIGYDGSYSVLGPALGGNGAQGQATAQAAVRMAESAASADRIAFDDATAVSQATDAQARAAVIAAQATVNADQAEITVDQAARLSSQAKLAADRLTLRHDQGALSTVSGTLGLTLARDRQAVHQAQAKLDGDAAALVGARAAAQDAGSHIYTRLPSAGDHVDRGQALFEIDNRAVPLFLGGRPLSRTLSLGASGPDVQELNQNLTALGFNARTDLGSSGSFASATASAVARWQASLGEPQTGTVGPSDVVVEPVPLRVTALHAVVGAQVQAGVVLLDASSNARVVNLPLDATSLTSVKTGDAVLDHLPTGQASAGTVSAVSSVAVQSAASGQGGQSGPPHATVNVTVVLSDPSTEGGLDQAPVTVAITNQQHQGVLAVPINALLALEEGGYAVKLKSGGGTLVGVTTGLFSDDGMVEVTGRLREGDLVEVPKA